MEFTVYEQIEELRKQMQKIASDKDLTDGRVLNVSKKLDLLINEFYIRKEQRISHEASENDRAGVGKTL